MPEARLAKTRAAYEMPETVKILGAPAITKISVAEWVAESLAWIAQVKADEQANASSQ